MVDTTTSTVTVANPTGIVKVGRPRISRDGKFVSFYGAGTDNTVKPFGGHFASTAQLLSLPASSTLLDFTNMLGTSAPAISNEIGSSNNAKFVYHDLTGRDCDTTDESADPNYLYGACIQDQQLYESRLGESYRVVTQFDNGSLLNKGGFEPAINSAGTLVFFQSASPEFSHSTMQIHVSSWTTSVSPARWKATSEVVSVNNAGTIANASAFTPSCSANGSYVAYVSKAGNLDINDNGGYADIFVRDRTNSVTYRAYTGNTDNESLDNGDSSYPEMAGGNRPYVTFVGQSANLVPLNYCDGSFCAVTPSPAVYVAKFTTGGITLESFKNGTSSPKVYKQGLFPSLSEISPSVSGVLMFSGGDVGIATGDSDTATNVYRKTGTAPF